MTLRTNNRLTPIYSTEKSQNYYSGLDGLRRTLESRSERAYYAYCQAEDIRQKILSLDLNPPLTIFQEQARALQPYSHDLHKYLTGVDSSEVADREKGLQLTASRLPNRPSSASDIRSTAEIFSDVAASLIRNQRYAKNCGDFDGLTNIYVRLWEYSVSLLGNAQTIASALSEGFERDTYEYLLRKHGEWDGPPLP